MKKTNEKRKEYLGMTGTACRKCWKRKLSVCEYRDFIKSVVKRQQDCRHSTRLLDGRMPILCANKYAYHALDTSYQKHLVGHFGLRHMMVMQIRRAILMKK